MENQEILSRILLKIEKIEEGQKQLNNEMTTFRKENKIGFQQLNDKLDLLTKQTSNAIIEHHTKDIEFLTSKIQNLEKDIYHLKRN